LVGRKKEEFSNKCDKKWHHGSVYFDVDLALFAAGACHDGTPFSVSL
jgi:hypothetical protein